MYTSSSNKESYELLFFLLNILFVAGVLSYTSATLCWATEYMYIVG